jgi:hypothetical protein
MKTPQKTKSKLEFWVTNISNRNVTLADLACNIKAYSTVNLADIRRYGLTLEQIKKSSESGSLLAKKSAIKPRDVAPPKEEDKPIPILHNAYIPSRQRSLFEIKEVKYEELEVSDDKEIQQKIDEQYASENADLELSDTQVAAITSKKV